MNIIPKSFLIWAGIIPLAILNGIFREAVLPGAVGEKTGLPLSGILLSVLIIAMTVLFLPKLGRARAATYLRMGLLWMLATVIFEFALGFATGNLWLIVILVVGASPWLAAKIRKII